MNKDEVKKQLSELISRYNETLRVSDRNKITEETIRTWLNDFLSIFGWDVKNTNQVLQEKILSDESKKRLQAIKSPHNKPDYILVNGINIKSFLDAKSIDVDIFTDSDVAYQIRSYGWSAKCPCAFVSNFEQFVIYDTRFIPDLSQPANANTIQICIDNYIEQFDTLYEHLWHDNICSNHLYDLYTTTKIEGKNQVDNQFMDILSFYRKKIALDIYNNNYQLVHSDIVSLNYYVQIILDRIVFIRVCESKGIEKIEKLKSFISSSEGFWNAFRKSCYTEFYNHYDGAMFAHDEIFEQLNLDNEILTDFVNKLYYPYPYCFDVIPIKVLANIYEVFLGSQIIIENGIAKEVSKEDYVRTNGAVATPEHIVEMICKQTISLDSVNNIEELLSITILDPCCGSGVFLVSCYERLASKMLDILSEYPKEQKKYNTYFYQNNGQMFLTITARRAIITHCIYAIDYDEVAFEVTKMSLALKIVDGNNLLAWDGIGVFSDKILQEIDNNIKLGNTLVDINGSFPTDLYVYIKPLNIQLAFSSVFEKYNGFHYVIGNPPYVETKYYKAALPQMHTYLRENYRSFEGKADLAVLFIERGIQMLNENGKLGFIIQRRWFKTEYGSSARNVINTGRYLEKLIDFKSTDIFPRRTVYASIMILNKRGKDSISYFYMKSSSTDIKNIFENSEYNGNFEGCCYESIPCQIGSSPWIFDSYNVIKIRNRLSRRFGNLRDYPGLAIKDGIQALWKKIYHLKNVQFKDGIAIGFNGFNERVTVEADILRGIIYNKLFYPFKDVGPDAYCIFPYEGNSTIAISPLKMQNKFPLTYNYLFNNEQKIKDNIECRKDEYWYAFTREHNHSMYNIDKIIIPMTAKDTIGTYISSKGLYMDNANVWFITILNSNEYIMKAITCIINSSVFSVLAKAGANPQTNDYYKFNKQFLSPIPFPSEKITINSKYTYQLSNLYNDIYKLQIKYISSLNIHKKIIAQSLKQKWEILDDICLKIYELSVSEQQAINDIGRTIDRIQLLKEKTNE